MRLAITGASGFIASALAPVLTNAGHEVIPVSRRPQPGGLQWDPDRGEIDAAALEGLDAVVHLAGAGLADRRWSPRRKRLLRQSRLVPTALLAHTLAQLRRPPTVLISMSAVGIYGDSQDRPLTEASPAGNDFLAELCRDWEAAADPARAAGIRVVHPRMGMVLSPDGGALPRMLRPFRWGVGGRLGSGRQWMSWIALDDALAGLHHCIATASLDGPVNLVAPQPVTNADFTTTLAAALRRPAIVPVPALALRAAFGELAVATLLTSQRAVPRVLESSGFQFRFDTLERALDHLLSG